MGVHLSIRLSGYLPSWKLLGSSVLVRDYVPMICLVLGPFRENQVGLDQPASCTRSN